MSEPILVTGATGKTGAAVARRLRAMGKELRTATRKPVAPDDVGFDWRDRGTYEPALKDVASVYLVAPTDTTEPLDVMRPFLELALLQGVERFVLLSASSLSAGEPMMGEIHAWLAGHASRWTALRPAWFMQNFTTQHLPAIRSEAAVYSATGDGRIAFIDVEDIAAVAAEALTDPDFANGLAPILTGPQSLSYDEAAAAISKVAGRPIRHVRLTVAELANRYEGFGLPSNYAAILADMDDSISKGAGSPVTGEVERLSGRPPSEFARFLAANRNVFRVGYRQMP